MKFKPPIFYILGLRIIIDINETFCFNWHVLVRLHKFFLRENPERKERGVEKVTKVRLDPLVLMLHVPLDLMVCQFQAVDGEQDPNSGPTLTLRWAAQM